MAILVYHTGALGDFITTIPALRYWKTRHKNERLVLLGKASIGEFAKDTSLIAEAYEVNDKRFLPLFLDKFSPDAEKLLSPFQTAILLAVPDSPIIKNVRQSGIPSLYWQPPFPAARIHAIDYHLSLFIDPHLLTTAEKIPQITPLKSGQKKSLTIIPQHLSPVAIHPGSGSRKKNWPFERYRALADALRKKGMPVIWLRGPADDTFEVPSGDILFSNQPLAVCAVLFSHCRAFVGNDSGMAHLAAGVGCRTIALFGPSDPMVWAPRGRDVRVIYKKWPCSPCHHRCSQTHTSCDGSCLSAITIDEVMSAVFER